jgi:hypothetical protein
MTATGAPITADTLADALARRHEPPEWWLAREVTLAKRRLDVLAVNLWGARSYRVIGYEIKVSRGDWMRELADWRKQEEWNRVVDDFYVVTPRGLVAPDELPLGWGLLELCGSGLRLRAHPAPSTPGDSLPREVIARLITRERDATHAERWQLEARLRGEAEAKAREEWAEKVEGARQAGVAAQRDYAALLHALGLRPSEWQAHEKALRAAAVYAEHRDHWDGVRRDLLARADRMATAEATLRTAAESLPVEQHTAV